MWVREFSKIYQGIKKEDVWKIWTDVNHWPLWHNDLEYCKMEGEFKEGNYFTLKPKGAPKVHIKLIEIIQGYKFTDCTHFIGAKMYDTHMMEETEDGIRLTNKLIVTGILGFLWIKLVAKNVADTVPQETDALVRLVRAKNA